MLYYEDFKTQMKEIKKLNKWRDIMCSWIRRFNIVKMSIFLKLIHSYNVIPVKIPTIFSVDIIKLILKTIWNSKESRIAMKNKVGGITIPIFETYYIGIVSKTAWYWLGKRHINQWKRKQNPRNGPTQMSPIDFLS